MNDRVFVDTNVFIYMQSEKGKQKKELSELAINNLNCITSAQVLSEICNVFTKQFAVDIDLTKQFIDAVLSTCEVVVIRQEWIKKALDIKKRYGYSYYDSLVIAAALESGCAYLLSEDLSDGQIIESKLEIINIYLRPDFVS
ncbi:MAG: PIN domain-containing protein [Oscillospiraceae bacterium]|nr:PIN domain-containing protein [Oscillospiraceae bacterium]